MELKLEKIDYIVDKMSIYAYYLPIMIDILSSSPPRELHLTDTESVTTQESIQAVPRHHRTQTKTAPRHLCAQKLMVDGGPGYVDIFSRVRQPGLGTGGERRVIISQVRV